MDMLAARCAPAWLAAVLIFQVPTLEEVPWPSLGWQLVPWMEQNLVRGPGDLRGQPLKLSPGWKALIYRMYEVYPQGDPRAGRRRFRRVAISVRKGLSKTETAAIITAAELHPRAPVRCIGWDKRGRPLGGPVSDPYIPMLAYTQEQSEELAYGALMCILGESKVAKDFDIGLARIMRRGGDGKAVPVSGSPDARDGARTTFSVTDEAHRLTLAHLKHAHRTMLANLPKRRGADAWGLEITTAPMPGEGSVAEDTIKYARHVAEGRNEDARLFFFHRQAADSHDLRTQEGVRAAVLEASEGDEEWSDIDGICEQFDDPTADRPYLERVWLNRIGVQAQDKAFDSAKWATLAKPGYIPADGSDIVIGFDGSRYRDSTVMVGQEIATGHLFVLGMWERPLAADGMPLPGEWEVPEPEVMAKMREAQDRWCVWLVYADPPHWEDEVNRWAGEYDGRHVHVCPDGTLWKSGVYKYFTNRYERKMAAAVHAFATAIATGAISHDGNPYLARHVGNACRRATRELGEDGRPMYLVTKERTDSPLRIDGAVASVLCNDARGEALSRGLGTVAEWDGIVTVLS